MHQQSRFLVQTIKHILFLYFLFGLLLIPIVIAVTYYSYGNFQLYLTENSGIGIQQNEGWLEIVLLSSNILNTSSFIAQTTDNGYMQFTSNINGEMQIETNMNSVKVQINEELSPPVKDSYIFTFQNGDLVKIIWRIVDATINAYIGLAGIILFCATPILAYVFSDNFREKYKFFMIFTVLGLMSLGLILTFIYSGI